MLNNRYVLWIEVWELFSRMKVKEVIPREEWDAVYNLLDRLWQDERQDAKPDELAAHAAALANLRKFTQ
jgi:hypothetical protein